MYVYLFFLFFWRGERGRSFSQRAMGDLYRWWILRGWGLEEGWIEEIEDWYRLHFKYGLKVRQVGQIEQCSFGCINYCITISRFEWQRLHYSLLFVTSLFKMLSFRHGQRKTPVTLPLHSLSHTFSSPFAERIITSYPTHINIFFQLIISREGNQIFHHAEPRFIVYN